MLYLILRRQWCTPKSTIGELYIKQGENELRQCFIIEDVLRPPGIKIHGKTAIPAGVYDVTITPSARFKKELPLLLSVPMFEGIRIHPGNTAADTEGCLLPGRTRSADFVGQSNVAFQALFLKLRAEAMRKGIIKIEIINPDPLPEWAQAPARPVTLSL